MAQRPRLRAAASGALLLAGAVAAAPPRAARPRLATWLENTTGVPAPPLLPSLRARRHRLPEITARLPDWTPTDADLRGARGHLRLEDRRLGRRLALRWRAARPGDLEALVRRWRAATATPEHVLEPPVPARVAGHPGLRVAGRVLREGPEDPLAPRRARSERERHWFWYDPDAARVHSLHLVLPGGDVVLVERLPELLVQGVVAGDPRPPPPLAPGIETRTAQGLGVRLDLPRWVEGSAREELIRSLRGGGKPAGWRITRSGNPGRRLLVVARRDGAAGVRLEWRPMPRGRTAQQVPVATPTEPAGTARDPWTICGHPARRSRYAEDMGKDMRWTQEVAWYCPESGAQYRLGVTTEESYAPGPRLMDEVPERVRCHLPAAQAWDPSGPAALTPVGEAP